MFETCPANTGREGFAALLCEETLCYPSPVEPGGAIIGPSREAFGAFAAHGPWRNHQMSMAERRPFGTMLFSSCVLVSALTACGERATGLTGRPAATDTTPPLAPAFELASPSPTDDPTVHLTVADCSDRAEVLVNEGGRPSATASGWGPCVTDRGAVEAKLGAGGGLHLLHAWSKDAAGNVSVGSTVVDVVLGGMFAIGVHHACALVAGAVRCWGANDAGQLGTGTNDAQGTQPSTVLGLAADVDAIGAGGDGSTTCALRKGTVWCWGNDDFGQLGGASAPTCTGQTHCARVPQQVLAADGSPLTKVVSLKEGVFSGCAELEDHTVRCWGDDQLGELGDGLGGKLPAEHRPATPVAGLAAAAHLLAAGAYSACAASPAGLACWGLDHTPYAGTGPSSSLLGGGDEEPCANGNSCRRAAAVHPSFIAATPELLAFGYFHACTLDHGRVRCWGLGTSGQLGNGAAANSLTPVDVSLALPATALVAGSHHTCAIVAGGEVACWGMNDAAQLGGATGEKCGGGGCATEPLAVLGLEDARALGAGRTATCVEAHQSILCWGDGSTGLLGPGPLGHCADPSGKDFACSFVPVEISGVIP